MNGLAVDELRLRLRVDPYRTVDECLAQFGERVAHDPEQREAVTAQAREMVRVAGGVVGKHLIDLCENRPGGAAALFAEDPTVFNMLLGLSGEVDLAAGLGVRVDEPRWAQLASLKPARPLHRRSTSGRSSRREPPTPRAHARRGSRAEAGR